MTCAQFEYFFFMFLGLVKSFDDNMPKPATETEDDDDDDFDHEV